MELNKNPALFLWFGLSEPMTDYQHQLVLRLQLRQLHLSQVFSSLNLIKTERTDFRLKIPLLCQRVKVIGKSSLLTREAQ